MTEKLMPDYSDALEGRLRDAAERTVEGVQERRARSLRRRLPRVAVPAVAAAGLAAAMFALSASDEHRLPKAFGKPLILQTPPVDATKVMHELQAGSSVMLTLGKDAQLTTARPVPAFGGTAYVVTGARGWCLTAPDPAVGDPSGSDPAREGAVTCALTSEVYKYGIALGVGNNVIAAIPQGVQDPTLTAPDGTVQRLHPSDQGVVAASGLSHGSVLTLFATDGTTRSLRLA